MNQSSGSKLAKPQRSRVLFVDDDFLLRQSMPMFLAPSFEVMTASSLQEAKQCLENHVFDVAISDLNFEGQENDGLDVISYMNVQHPRLPVVVFSGDTNTARVMAANRLQVYGCVPKDESFEMIKQTVEQAIMFAQKMFSQRPEQDIYSSKNKVVNNLLKDIEEVLLKSNEGTILINGETGTGKEILVQHIGSKIGKKVFAINMATIPREMAASELFGHKKGSFTGAIADKIGLLESADGGILFLDEIGETDLNVQAMLLRAIQEKEITPVGDTKPRKLNVRIIAATLRDLKEMVTRGTFRPDLYQRLTNFTFKLPPLRERPEDIEYYLNMFLAKSGQGKSFHIEPQALLFLQNYKWPGNIRELEATVIRMLAWCNGRTISLGVVQKSLPNDERREIEEQPQTTKRYDKLVTREELIQVLQKNNGNRITTAKDLGCDDRSVRRLIAKFDLAKMFPAVRGRAFKLLVAQDEGT